MVPQIRNRDQNSQVFERQHTEVSDAHGNAGQQPMQTSIKMIETAEDESFASANSLRKDHTRGIALFEPVEKPRHILRTILAIRIHNDNAAAGEMFVNPSQTDRDRSLMSEVPPQIDDDDFVKGRGGFYKALAAK